MALNISNQRVENKAIQASRALGVNKTAAVEIALDYYLENHGKQHDDGLTIREVSRLLDEMAAIPVQDRRDPDEILGYDKDGLV